MALTLSTVQDYVTDARNLLLDKVQPYRYDDDSMVRGLNLALREGFRLRPDLFLCRYATEIPKYGEVSGAEVPIEDQFQLAFAYGIASIVLLRDEEDVQDLRAAGFRDQFEDILVGRTLRPVHGGTPAAPGKQGA